MLSPADICHQVKINDVIWPQVICILNSLLKQNFQGQRCNASFTHMICHYRATRVRLKMLIHSHHSVCFIS